MALPTPSPTTSALVTGASSGIGAAVARRLAAHGHNVILVARRVDRLEELATELRSQHAVKAEAIPADLADAESRAALVAAVRAAGQEVGILVNNAGFATGGRYIDSAGDREVEQVRVLVEAVVELTSAFLPGMVERREGAVLNVASPQGSSRWRTPPATPRPRHTRWPSARRCTTRYAAGTSRSRPCAPDR